MNRLFLFNIFICVFFFSCSSGRQQESRLINKKAIWVESSYFRGYSPSTGKVISQDDIKLFAQKMKVNNIQYAYIFSGPFLPSGHLPDFAFSSHAVESVRLIQKIYPELSILPWVGGIQNKTVFLNDSTWVNNAISSTKRLIDVLNVPGVHVDFELIVPGNLYLDKQFASSSDLSPAVYDEAFVEFHKLLRIELPNEFISSVVYGPSNYTRPWKRKTSLYDINLLIPHTNQLSFLFYDTKINNQYDFSLALEEHLSMISELKKDYANCEFFFGIGTFINEPELQIYRNENIESISNTLVTIDSIFEKSAGKITLFDGISIYCNWETTENEWLELKHFQ